jgi:MtN3 and saliva related transmembrane protein
MIIVISTSLPFYNSFDLMNGEVNNSLLYSTLDCGTILRSSMKHNYIAIIGFIAGTLTTLSFLPQVIKTFKTRQTKDISIAMYIVLASGLFTWIIYGILMGAVPIILANLLAFIMAVVILLLKIKYG